MWTVCFLTFLSLIKCGLLIKMKPNSSLAHFVRRRVKNHPRTSIRIPNSSGDDTVGNPHRARISQFELFELILLMKLDKQFPGALREASRRAYRHQGGTARLTLLVYRRCSSKVANHVANSGGPWHTSWGAAQGIQNNISRNEDAHRRTFDPEARSTAVSIHTLPHDGAA